ncbi:MAG: hypothetical protein GX802_06165 [Clostridiales bacterium]|nr:hypothetical protein [Clostridiales bacterium]
MGKKRKSSFLRLLYMVFIIAFVLIIGACLLSQRTKVLKIEKEIAEQKQKAQELELEKNRLRFLASYAECEGFSRDIIRNKLGYVSPFEVLFAFE